MYFNWKLSVFEEFVDTEFLYPHLNPMQNSYDPPSGSVPVPLQMESERFLNEYFLMFGISKVPK